MTRHRLLIAVAATALAVGSGAACAQSPGGGAEKSQHPAAGKIGGGPAGASRSTHSGTTGSGAMNEPKGATSELQKGAASEQKGMKKGMNMRGARDEKARPGNERFGQSGRPASKSETTGQAPSENHSGNAQGSEQSNGGKSDRLDKKTQDNERMNRNGRAERGSATTGQGNSQGANQSANPSGTMQRQGGAMQNEREGGMNRPGENATTGSAVNTTVNLSSEQRTRIKDVILGARHVRRVSHVDFALNVGTAIPRGDVTLVTVPPRIVRIEPAWRGFEYFVVADQIVIVNPRTLEIVAVIES